MPTQSEADGFLKRVVGGGRKPFQAKADQFAERLGEKPTVQQNVQQALANRSQQSRLPTRKLETEIATPADKTQTEKFRRERRLGDVRVPHRGGVPRSRLG